MDHRTAAKPEKRCLQVVVALAALVPVGAGLAGVILGPGLTSASDASASTDSHARYLSGLLLGVGLAFWLLVPGIERHGFRFRLLAGIVVAGGLGRALSLMLAGTPSPPMLGALGLELGLTPLLAWWQVRVARRARPTACRCRTE